MNVAQLVSAMKTALPANEISIHTDGSLAHSQAGFGQLLAHLQLVEGNGLLTEENGEMTSLNELFAQLIQLLSEELTGEEAALTSQHEVNQAELMSYLQEMIQLIEKMENLPANEMDLEALYALFQEVPVQLNLGELLTQGNQSSMKQQVSEEVLPILKWAVLMESLHQKQNDGTQHALVSQHQISSKVQELLHQLENKWNKQQDWVKYVLNKLDSEKDLRSLVTTSAKGSSESSQSFKSFLPTTLLIQADGKNLAHSQPATENGEPTANQKVVPFVQKDADVTQMIPEAKGKELLAEVKIQESPIPTAKFSTLLQDVKDIMKSHFQLLKQDDSTQIRIKIFPEHLGHLDIRVISAGGKVSAYVTASTQLAKEALEQQVNQLRMALVQQGIQVDRIEVTQQTQSNQSLLNQDSRQGQQFSGRREQGGASKEQGYEEQENEPFDLQLEADEVANINYVV